MNDMSVAPDRLPVCRYYVAAAERRAFVAELPEWTAPALDAMIHGKKPIQLRPAKIEELRRAGVPLRASRKGTVLLAGVEGIRLLPPEPIEQPSRFSRYCGC